MAYSRRDVFAFLIGSFTAGSLLNPSAALAAAGTGPLSSVGERYGLIYFFAQSCNACKVQTPIVVEVQRMGLNVLALSEDGGPIPEFPNYRVNTGQRARMGIAGKVTPALALFDSRTRQVKFIGEGVFSLGELLAQIQHLTAQ